MFDRLRAHLAQTGSTFYELHDCRWRRGQFCRSTDIDVRPVPMRQLCSDLLAGIRMIGLLMPLLVLTSAVSVQAGTAEGNVAAGSSAITGLTATVVTYAGGEFKRQVEPGVVKWIETTTDGREFQFNETGRDEHYINLRDDSRQYTVQLHLQKRQIFIAAGKRPLFEDLKFLYTITDVSALVVDGLTVTEVTYKEGKFQRRSRIISLGVVPSISVPIWVETTTSGREFQFDETGRNEHYITLRDDSRQYTVQFHLQKRQILIAREKNPSPENLKFLYEITNTSAIVSPPAGLRLAQYIIAHRCNEGDWVKNVVNEHGVNGIEADFRYAHNEWNLAHDNIAGTFLPLDTWLADASTVASKLALLHVDIKSPEGPLDNLYDRLRAKFPGVGLIFDFGAVSNGQYLDKIEERILSDPLAVAAFGFDDSPTKVMEFFRKRGFPLHKYWYEIGLAAGFVGSQTEADWAKQTILMRKAGFGPRVVVWTYEKEASVKAWLDDEVDAILVNSSSCYGRTSALVSDADVHVKNAKAKGKYGKPGENPFQ
ncbi:MAG: hypothetical protein LZF86_190467 [Nitrospira sp.]|nr:MAG: hypothetical protein LZF86_190467 [Nitrospira sp.]